ncbi:MAG TPA: ferrochelatase [Steroidobacteraceae bacterium]|nr:ferrochelatase [Steroidobacteraceae bacterium]
MRKVPSYVNAPVNRDAATSRIGVLLVNTGTPDAPTTRGVRRFLAEMLSDPRLVELPRALWLPILHGVILRVRPRRSAHAYRKIWTSEGSPQLVIMQRIARALSGELERVLTEPVAVQVGMCYGDPSIPAALAALRDAGAGRILVLPLFPQYAGVTTASAFDRVNAELRLWRCVPEMRCIAGYHTEPGYIEALRQSVLEHWRKHGRAGHLLMSFHSMPVSCAERGDPYRGHCESTAHALAAALQLKENEWSLSFQSRFGWQEWLQPYTADVVRSFPGAGRKRLDTLCPGFAVDCLESLEEIALAARALFLAQGGESFHYIAALNDRETHVRFLAQLIARHCGGWSDIANQQIEREQAAGRRA